MIKTKLDLVFTDSQGKNFRLAVDEPRKNLEEEEVRAAMEGIIEEGVFHTEAKLEAIKEANKVVRTVKTII